MAPSDRSVVTKGRAELTSVISERRVLPMPAPGALDISQNWLDLLQGIQFTEQGFHYAIQIFEMRIINTLNFLESAGYFIVAE